MQAIAFDIATRNEETGLASKSIQGTLEDGRGRKAVNVIVAIKNDFLIAGNGFPKPTDHVVESLRAIGPFQIRKRPLCLAGIEVLESHVVIFQKIG